MPDSFFKLFSIIIPLIYYLFFFFFIYVVILALRANSQTNRVRKNVSSQMDNIFSQISKTLNPEPKKEEKNSRNEFFKMQKNYSSKNVDSFTYKKESVKDASLSEAERNVLYGK